MMTISIRDIRMAPSPNILLYLLFINPTKSNPTAIPKKLHIESIIVLTSMASKPRELTPMKDEKVIKFKVPISRERTIIL